MFTNRDQRVSVSEAVERRMIETEIATIVDPNGRRITLGEAIDSGVVDPARCTLKVDAVKSVSWETALRDQLIVKPLTLKECVDRQLVSADGTIVDPLSSSLRPVSWNLLRAAKAGLLDVDSTKSVADSQTGQTLTLAEALSEGIIIPSGLYVERPHGATMTLEEASELGLLLSEGLEFLPPRRPSTGSENDPPPNGWPLKVAIENKYLDTNTGLFAVPGTDRLVSLEECILLSIIRPDSASVLDPSTKHYIPILRAFEKKILTPTGHYKEPNAKALNIREALNRYHIIFVDDDSVSPSSTVKRGFSPRRERQSSVEGSPPKMKPPSLSESPSRREISRNKSVDAGSPFDDLPPPDLQDIRLAPGVIFAPSSGVVSIDETKETLNLLEALKRNVVQPSKVKVRDPTSPAKELSVTEAIRKGIVSKETGDYKYSGGRTLSLLEAVRVGVVTVIGRPASEPEAVMEVAKSSNTWKDVRIKLVDPFTGAEVTWESALERHVLDADTVTQLAAKVTDQHQPKLTAELLSCIILSDATTGKQLPVKDGLDHGIVTERRLVELIQEQKPVPYRLMDLVGIPLDGSDYRKMSLAQQTRSKITTEPKFSVAIGRARSVQQEPGKLQRIRRKVMKPREAAIRGLVDAQTAELLEVPSASIETLIKQQKIDAETTGAISDVLRGHQLTLREALERGVLDDETGEMQFPVASSVSVTEAVERGLYDQHCGCFIHPENGSSLSLAEAVQCEIIDPQTQVVDARSEERKSVALSLAIAIGLVDEKNGDVQTANGPVSMMEAVATRHLYLPSPRIWAPQVPPVGLTLPVALDRKLIDASALEMIHPSTGRRMALEQAIDNHLIMAIPYPAAPEYVLLRRAIEKRMLDVDRKTFTDTAGRKMNVTEALERGILVIKRPIQYHSTVVSSVESTRLDETLVSTETLITRNVQCVPGYTLIGGDQVKNERTGRIMTLEKAGRLGLIIGIQADQLSFQEAVSEGFVHLASGTFTRPGTHERMTINLALKEGWLRLDGYSDVRLNKTSSKMTAETLIYDYNSQQMISVQQAIRSGLLGQNGEYQQSGKALPFNEAVRSGLVAVLGVPEMPGRDPDSMPVLFNLSPVCSREANEPVLVCRSRRTSIRNALKEERIASQAQLVVRKSRMSVDEALRQNLATPTAIISIEENDQIHLVGEPDLHISPVDILDRDFAIEHGFYDPSQELFVDIETGDSIRVADATALGILNGKEILIKDVRCNSVVTLDEALDKQIVDPVTGHMIDPKKGKKIAFYEAVRLGWIEASPAAHRAHLGDPITFKYVVNKGWYAVDSGLLSLPKLKTPVQLSVAIRHQYVNPDSVIFRVFSTGEDLTLTQAAQRGWIDPLAGAVKQNEDAKPIDFAKAVQSGLLQPKRKAIALEAAIRNGSFNGSNGRITESVCQKALTIEETINWGLIDAFISEIHDTKRQKMISLEEALESRLVDSGKGRLMNTATGQWMDLVTALKQGLISTQTTTLSIFDAVNDGLYDPDTGKFSNPFTGRQETLRESIDSGLIDGSSARVRQEDESYISLGEGAESLEGQRLDQAIDEKKIIPLHKAWSLQEALAHQLYERETGLFVMAGRDKITLHTAIQKGFIQKSALTVKDPRSSDILSLGDAIKMGIIDSTSGMAIDPSTSVEMDFVAAMERGLIIGAKRKLSITEALLKGMYDMKSGRFSTLSEVRKPKLPTDVAIRNGVIDSTANLVRNFKTGNVVTFEQAVREQLIDVKQGTLRISAKQTSDFQQALDGGFLIEVQRPLFLSEAMVKEVFNHQTGLFLDPLTGQWLTLIESIESGLIDPESVHVKDTRFGFLRKTSLTTAIELGTIDGQTTRVTDLSSGKEYTLAEAFTNELIVDSKAPVSIQRMIHQGLYDEATGRVTDPNSGRKITIHEALRRCVLHPLLPCFFERQTGNLLSLAETCRNGIIDRQTGLFRLPQSKLEMPLNKALEREFILDIEQPFSLYDAVRVGFFDRHRNCFFHPTNGRRLNLDVACKENLIQATKSIVKHGKTGRYMKLDEAVCIGLIDAERNAYCLPGSSDMTFPEALERCFIVTSKSGLTLEEAIRNGLYAHETGKFVDPSVGDLLDLNQALKHGLIDGSTTALKDASTGSLKSLNSAIEDGDIDGVRGRVVEARGKRSMNLETAVEEQVIVTVDRALTFNQAVRDGDIDLTIGTFVDPRTSCRHTLEEAIRHELIDPQSAVIKNPQTGGFITVKRAITEGIVDMRKRAIVDRQTGHLGPLCIIFEQGTVVFHRQTIGFDEAIEQGQFNLKIARLMEPSSNEELNLKQAVAFGCLNSDSVLVRDNLHRQLLKLSAAFELAIVDADQGLVLDNSSGKQVTLSEALATGLIVTPKRQLSLIEAIEFGLYNIETGRFSDPFTQRSLTLAEVVDTALLDFSTNLAKDPETGRILSITQAIEEGLVNASSGRLADMNLAEALSKGFLLTTSARQAMEERYKLCDDGMARLLVWISNIEAQLANQDTVREDVAELKNQINVIRGVRDDMESHSRPVNACLDQVRQIVSQGGEYLSADEINTMESKGQELKKRYDTGTDQTDKLLRKVSVALDELHKFRTEISNFKTWIVKSNKLAEEKERQLANLSRVQANAETTREFVSDVIAHQADLRFITMAAQKFVDESMEYLAVLNDFRDKLPQRMRHIEPSELLVKAEVVEVTEDYQTLMKRANRLSDKMTDINSKNKDYQEIVTKAKAWLKEVEPKATKIVSEPLGAEPKAVEDQLGRAKALNNDVMANERLVNHTVQAATSLLTALDGDVSEVERSNLESVPADIQDRYKKLLNALTDKCQFLDNALVQSQGVQEALDSLANWLSQAENQLKNMTKPTSLNKDRLDEQLREHRVLVADIDSHRAGFESINEAAAALVANPDNARVARKIEAKMKDMNSRYEKLQDKVYKRGYVLEEIYKSLDTFTTSVTQFDDWYQQVWEILDASDQEEAEQLSSRIEDISQQKDQRRENFDNMLQIGRTLVVKKDIADATPVREKIKTLEMQWKDLSTIIEQSLKDGKARTDQLHTYEKLRDQVLEWLTKNEGRVDALEPVAVDADILKRQTDELRPIMKEYRDYETTISRVADLGTAYENMSRPAGDTSRKPSIVSPSKRSSITTLRRSSQDSRRPSQDLRRQSQDLRTPSPNKVGMGALPVNQLLSSVASSGFSGRRSSQDFYGMEDSSVVQKQIADIYDRYGQLGSKLHDRKAELELMTEEAKKHTDALKTLAAFLDKVERQLPRDSAVPQTRDDAEKQLRSVKNVLEDMYDKQPQLDGLKTQVTELLRRKSGVPGADALQDQLVTVSGRWKDLQDRCKARSKFLEDVKDFHDTHDQLSAWLTAKDRMMSVLGPISSDPRLVHHQLQQVQVLREEFKAHEPQVQHLERLADLILEIAEPNSNDGRKVNDKVVSISAKWSDLIGRLEERKQNLDAASGTSRQFYANLGQLQDALQKISDNLEELAVENVYPEEILKHLEDLQDQLESQRPLIAGLETVGEQLCAVLSDASSKAEVAQKLSQIDKMHAQLQKKLDNRRAELENLLKDNREFEDQCGQLQEWLGDCASLLVEALQVSADRDVLRRQLQHNEPAYKDVMDREHEVIMMLDKGQELANQSPNKNEAKAFNKLLEKIRGDWNKVRQETVSRHRRLQTCMELCRKYDGSQEMFLPWLDQAEAKLNQMQPVAFKKSDLDAQVKDLQSFRNDISRHSATFETNRSLGESFLSACDVDKEGVKNELTITKERWDQINAAVLERSQSLEDIAQRLAEFIELLRDSQHAMQRCEDRLSSHDALGPAARDSRLLDRIRTLLDEAVQLEKGVDRVHQYATGLVADAASHDSNASHIQDQAEDLARRYSELRAHLEDRCNMLETASVAVLQFNEHVKAVLGDLSTLETELDSMSPAGRDLDTLNNQLDQTHHFLAKLEARQTEVEAIATDGQNLVSEGHAPDAQGLRDQLDSLRKQTTRLEDRGKNRLDELEKTLVRVESFYDLHSNIMQHIDEASNEERAFKPIVGDVELVRQQQEEFRSFKQDLIIPLGQNVEEANRSGQGLVQSAANGVSTTALESDLEKMNDRWNNLKEKLNDRERRLDVAFLQSGKFQEALQGLSKWLSDTEEMVANQKPPSADYKVVKAQLQEQKFLKKLLLDRQQSMSSLLDMGQDIANHAHPEEQAEIEEQLQELVARFDALTNGADDRMEALEKAMAVAKEFQDKFSPIADWLEKMERKIKDMEIVPTDEEKIQQRIEEHDLLHDDILSKKPAFDSLTDIATNLMSLVGEEEASVLADRLTELTDRYGALVENSEALGRLLSDAKTGLRHLVLSYEDLLAWMESMESKLFKYRILSVHVEKLQEQMEELMYLTEEVAGHQPQVESVVDTGLELMRHITNEEALQLKEKLDSVQRRYTDLTGRADDLLKHAQETLPLVEQFHVSHNRLANWLLDAEDRLQALDSSSAASGGSAGLDVQESIIARLESELSEVRPFLDMVNQSGPQLCQRCPGEGSAYIESLITRDNRRFDAICEQIQRKAERLHLSKQRSMEVVGDLDELLDWFRETEQQLRESEPPSSDPEVIRVQLKEHKVIGDEISTQKGRVRDILSAAQKVLRESPQTEDSAFIREKMEDLKETRDRVSELSADRLSILEQALPLAEHFYEAHSDLSNWLGEIEEALSNLDDPAIRPEQIVRQQEGTKLLMAEVAEHKPLFDKLNKTGTTLAKLCIEEEGVKVHDILESDNARYAALRSGLRERQQALEEALQETSQFSDKLDGMLAALATAFEQVKSAEPVAAHPDKIQEQMQENQSVVEDLEKRESAFEAVKRAADEVIVKNPSDPAVKDIEGKLKKLSKLWDTVVSATGERGKSLEEALAVAERFWEELQAVMRALKELQETLVTQEPPAVEPAKIHQQQATLQDIKTDIEHTKPEVEHCRQVGQELINLCGEPDKPEVKKHIEELDSAWDNITALYAKREENLIDAMEKAMEYHDTLNSLAEFLEKAEKKFHEMRPLGTDIETVKEQIEQLKAFKADVDPQMVKVETLNRSLNRQAADLADRSSPDQAARLKEPLAKVNRRWEDLLRGVVDRQRELEHALLRLGQFQHALNELLVWIQRTDSTLDELKPVFGDPSVIEVELAKLKVLINDIQAHQTSVDTLNDAGRQLVETDKGSDDSNKTQQRLVLLNKKWGDLVEKASSRQKELEDALREAQQFTAEIQDLLLWLNDIDGALSMSKPVGGLPETASDQLQRFMEVYHELEKNRPLVESCLQRGAEYLKRSTDGAAVSLQHNLRTLKQRWDNVMNRANDKKIKLEIALKEATEFHDALQAFIDWLTNAEKTLGGLKPASRVMETVLSQIEEHKSFQKDIAAQREVMLSLDKKGTHLKYFSQKQDVILIKNLLISVQHRWERVLSRAAERTRALDHAYKEAKEYHDSWHELYSWLDEAEKGFDDAVLQLGKDPEKIKQLLAKHKEFQRTLGAKQPTYDGIVRLGKLVKDRAPKTDEPTLKQMMSDLKAKWQSVCNKSVDRQRKLEEGLLFSGQFKDAIQALVDWLCKTNPAQMMEGPVHGDLDTVMALREQHKNFEEELNSRLAQTKQVRKMAVDVMANASEEDRAAIQKQVSELDVTWENVSKAASTRSANLDDALVQAETLHKAVNMLLEWLSDAEMKLRFAGALPDEEPETKQQLADHHKFLEEVIKKETDKDDTLALAQDILGKAHPDAVSVIRHWITIIQARWEEVMAWANQREHRLNEHLRNLREMASMLEELLAWLATAEKTLITLEAEPIPDDLPIIEGLIKDHQEFMEDMAKRQPEVDRVCKTKQAPRTNQPGKMERKPSRNKSTSSVPDREFSQSPTRESSPEHDTPARRSSRVTPDRENSLIPRLVRPSYKPQSRESTPGPQQQSRKPSQATSPSPARDGSPSRDYPKPWMVGTSRSSPGREKTPDNYWPHIGPRFAPAVTPVGGNSRKGSKVSVEMLPRNPRARQLWDRWRNVWMMAWDRQRRLHDKLNYLQELEKVKNFSWDDWRRRFMKYMNNKKSRVTDLFRKMDKNNEGFIPREDFIEGIMKTKFPTSRMEMNAVANMFDRNNEGYIDWKEFLAALRPDWEERPTTEDEIIHDEVKRAVNQCTCRNRFKVHQVGEGQYRFGDSQKLRLVRILRSTVMVRVGGGWVALDEFLVKNDPCRVVIIPHIRVRTPGEHEFWCPFFSKGRTNLELREQFILPEGASQGMTPFKTRASPNSSVSSQPGTGQMVVSPLHARSPSLPTAGPITKVRERTVRSSPMRPSFSAGTPDSSVSESDGSFHLHSGRKASAPPRTMMSGGGSHSGSRPASRNADSKHGSIQSLDSYDGGYAQKTPTGIRRTPSFQRPDSASRNQPGSSSTLPRKRSTIPSPVETRARHPSGSSASGVSPSPSGGFNGGGISAASRARQSITASHRSSISSSRPVGRTASGSSGAGTPGTPGMMRREGTSDSMTGIARKTTSTGIRKPSGTPLSRPSPK
ncbi:microtubule-actin cross-linking factor 1 isoform X20 [Daphnia magna]|uniref:microtubule-actin cross-linking factor 1 isoform X20 n=1 Tax=Daphnia magna TaxID=35525 RepID=UPI001E1BD070|nr:microtubule-actin cross-linking factor 1 isoform X20 [Daphnia magna]